MPPVIKSDDKKVNFVNFNNLILGETWGPFITTVDPTVSDKIINGATYPNTTQEKLLTQTGYDVFAQYFFDAINIMYK